MGFRPKVTLIGVSEIGEFPGADIRAHGYGLPDLLLLGGLSRHDLVILDFNRGIPPLPQLEDFPPSAADDDELLKEARGLAEFFSSPNRTEQSLKASGAALRLLLEDRILPVTEALLAKDEGKKVKGFSIPKTFRAETVHEFLKAMSDVSEDDQLHNDNYAKLMTSVFPKALQKALAQIWAAVHGGTLAVLIIPKDLVNEDAAEIGTLFASILPPVRLHDACPVERPPACRIPQHVKPAAAAFLAGHGRFMLESRSHVEVQMSGRCVSSGRVPLQVFAPFMGLPAEVLFSPATATAADNGDGQARSLLLECGNGAVVLIPGDADVGGLAELAIRCVLDPETEPLNPDGLAEKIPLVFTEEPCRPSPGHDGWIVRAGTAELKFAAIGYQTLLAFAVASEYPVKSINPSCPMIGGFGFDGKDVRKLFLKVARGTEHTLAYDFNKKFKACGLPAVLVPAPRPPEKKKLKVYCIDVGRYSVDLSKLSGKSAKPIAELLGFRPAAAR